ncbi:MAG TPA: BTAD domain-containing putative transcriptional regulator, partial [Chloroflexota bacterium]|nr:BTAD domain-containing putative transcriptional regulator [Chloroflexota bacterium]
MRDVSGVRAVTELAGRDGGATQAPVAEGLRIHLLGGFRVSTGQVPAVSWRLRTAAALVKLLALAPGHRLHREQVLEWLWPEAEPAAAANRFYHALYAARRALQPGLARGRESPYLHLQGDLLTLSPQVAPWIDLEAFQAAAASARRLRDATRYWEAIDGFSADLLPEDRYEDWCRPAAEAHRATYLALLAEVAELHEARGEHTLATDALRRLLLYDPAHEGAHRGLMRLYASCGRRQEALRQFAQLEEALRRELDAQPDAATRSLYEAICSGDFPPSSPASPVHSFVSGGIPAAQQAAAHAAARGPAGGGDAAGFSQLTSFVGRARERSEAARLLATARLVTLTGPGGVGKTRLALQLAAEAGEIGVEPAPPAPAARSDSASGPCPRASRLGSDGVYLVSLAPVRDPALVVATIARTLGLADHAAPAVGVIPHAEDGLARRPAAGGAEGGDVPPTPAPHPL